MSIDPRQNSNQITSKSLDKNLNSNNVNPNNKILRLNSYSESNPISTTIYNPKNYNIHSRNEDKVSSSKTGISNDYNNNYVSKPSNTYNSIGTINISNNPLSKSNSIINNNISNINNPDTNKESKYIVNYFQVNLNNNNYNTNNKPATSSSIKKISLKSNNAENNSSLKPSLLQKQPTYNNINNKRLITDLNNNERRLEKNSLNKSTNNNSSNKILTNSSRYTNSNHSMLTSNNYDNSSNTNNNNTYHHNYIISSNSNYTNIKDTRNYSLGNKKPIAPNFLNSILPSNNFSHLNNNNNNTSVNNTSNNSQYQISHSASKNGPKLNLTNFSLKQTKIISKESNQMNTNSTTHSNLYKFGMNKPPVHNALINNNTTKNSNNASSNKLFIPTSSGNKKLISSLDSKSKILYTNTNHSGNTFINYSNKSNSNINNDNTETLGSSHRNTSTNSNNKNVINSNSLVNYLSIKNQYNNSNNKNTSLVDNSNNNSYSKGKTIRNMLIDNYSRGVSLENRGKITLSSSKTNTNAVNTNNNNRNYIPSNANLNPANNNSNTNLNQSSTANVKILVPKSISFNNTNNNTNKKNVERKEIKLYKVEGNLSNSLASKPLIQSKNKINIKSYNYSNKNNLNTFSNNKTNVINTPARNSNNTSNINNNTGIRNQTQDRSGKSIDKTIIKAETLRSNNEQAKLEINNINSSNNQTTTENIKIIQEETITEETKIADNNNTKQLTRNQEPSKLCFNTYNNTTSNKQLTSKNTINSFSSKKNYKTNIIIKQNSYSNISDKQLFLSSYNNAQNQNNSNSEKKTISNSIDIQKNDNKTRSFSNSINNKNNNTLNSNRIPLNSQNNSNRNNISTSNNNNHFNISGSITQKNSIFSNNKNTNFNLYKNTNKDYVSITNSSNVDLKLEINNAINNHNNSKDSSIKKSSYIKETTNNTGISISTKNENKNKLLNSSGNISSGNYNFIQSNYNSEKKSLLPNSNKSSVNPNALSLSLNKINKLNSHYSSSVDKNIPNSNSNYNSCISLENSNNKSLSIAKKKLTIDKIQLPMIAKTALAILKDVLTSREKEELDKLATSVYFLGEIAKRIENNDNPNTKQKEEDDGSYEIIPGNHIKYRYEILDELGRGSFGQALKCYDHYLKTNICLKIIKNKKKFTNQAKIEIRLLHYINQNDRQEESNVIKMVDNFTFRNHVVIIFELLDINLYELLKYQDFCGLEMSVIRKIAIQLLYTLIFLQKHRVIHCDMKPENILLKKFGKTGIKVIDFGSSCFEGEKLYSYIQSRFYRAPEIILGLNYGIEIDMWSFGCIIAELYTGIPIFPGENEVDQLNYIMEYFGPPSDDLINIARKKNQFFEPKKESNPSNNDNTQSTSSIWSPLKIPNSRGKVRQPFTKKLEKFLKNSDESFIELVKMCLEWDPNKRIKPDEAILHEWITEGMPSEILEYHKKNYYARMNIGDTGGSIKNKNAVQL